MEENKEKTDDPSDHHGGINTMDKVTECLDALIEEMRESRAYQNNLSLISIYPPYFYIFLDRITLQVRFKSSVFSYTPPPHARIPGKHVFQRPRGHLFMVGFKRKDLVFFYGIMLFTA